MSIDNALSLFLCYNFIEDVAQTEQNATKQQSNSKFILLNLCMITHNDY